MTGIYTAELYRDEAGNAVWRILDPAGETCQDGIASDHDVEAILADWNEGRVEGQHDWSAA